MWGSLVCHREGQGGRDSIRAILLAKGEGRAELWTVIFHEGSALLYACIWHHILAGITVLRYDLLDPPGRSYRGGANTSSQQR